MCGDAEEVNFFTPPYQLHISAASSEYGLGGKKNVWAIRDIGNGQSKWCAGGIVKKTLDNCHERPLSDYKIVKEIRFQPDKFQQRMEYMGRSGNILKFIYAEFSDNLAREAYNRNFQVDLSEGNTVNYKGAEIEIIQADNVSVTYVINKYFGGAE